jgi:hypothetical protein
MCFIRCSQEGYYPSLSLMVESCFVDGREVF